MSIRAAIGRIRERVLATTPTTVRDGYPARFSMLPQAADDRLPVTRGGWIEIVDGVRKGPYTTGKERHLYNVDIAVYYEGRDDRLEQEIVVAEDRISLSRQILDETGWDDLNTGLVSVSAGGDDQETLLPATKDRLDDGGIIQRLSLVLEVIE
jgi:hypothetical protein